MLDLVISPSLTVNRECPDRLKLNLTNIYATVPDDIEGRLLLLFTAYLVWHNVYVYKIRELATHRASACNS